MLEADQAEAPSAGQVAAVAINDHAQRGNPRAGAERLLRGVQRGRPDAFEQVARGG
jgi:hypothetical protein